MEMNGRISNQSSKLTSSNAASNIKHLLLGLQFKFFQKRHGRVNSAGGHESSTENLLISQNTISRVLFVILNT